MKRLTDEQQATRAKLVDALNSAAVEIKAAHRAVNDRVSDLNVAISNYNDVVAEVRKFRDEVVAQMSAYAHAQNPGWGLTDEGSDYHDWVTNWSYIDTSDVDTELEVDLPDMDLPEDLEEASGEPSNG